jgi:multiple sugar transport system permease protein
MARKTAFIPYMILALIALIFIWPFLWLVCASFDTSAPLTIRLPEQWTGENYAEVLGDAGNLRSFRNGLTISLSQASLVVVAAVMAAYPLSRFRLRWMPSFMYSLLFLTGLPITAIMIPAYMLFFRFGLIDSIPATILFLTSTSLPYSIWMMKNFMDGVEIELEEAAAIDGASTPQIIRRIVLPLMLPGVFVIFISAFLGSWGNFFVPFMLLSSMDKLPPSVTIYQFFASYGRVSYGQLAAFSVLYISPIAMLYVLAQRYMSKGFVMSGAVK